MLAWGLIQCHLRWGDVVRGVRSRGVSSFEPHLLARTPQNWICLSVDPPARAVAGLFFLVTGLCIPLGDNLVTPPES